MSNSSSLSAAKRRRGGGPPIGQTPGVPGTQAPPQMGGGNLPPGLPPNFRQMPPQLQQQILRQIQQRMMQAQQVQQQQQQQQHVPLQQNPQNMPIGISISSNNMNEKMPPKISGAGPYVVNSVLHNRAISEVDGIHIRDLPMSAAGLPCLPSGAALPPNILFKLHHDELLNQDATINDYSNRLQMLTNRVDKIERGVAPSNSQAPASFSSSSSTSVSQEEASTDMNGLASNTEFIAKILDNILTNTNLSDIINQIEPLQKENESLRALLHSQQTTLNELSTLVMKLINGSLPLQHQHQHQDQSELNVNNFTTKYEDINDEFCTYVNGIGGETGEEIHNSNIYEQSQNEEHEVTQEEEEQEGQEEGQEEQAEQEEQEEGGQEV
jgi:hypothetical protein